MKKLLITLLFFGFSFCQDWKGKEIYFSQFVSMSTFDIHFSKFVSMGTKDIYITNNRSSSDISICFPRGFDYDNRHIISIVYLTMFHKKD